MTCEEAKLIAEILGEDVPTAECPQEEERDDSVSEESEGDMSEVL